MPTDERFLDVGRLLVHMAAETNDAELAPCEEGCAYLLPRREQGVFYAWPPEREDAYCGPDRAASRNLQPLLHVGRGSSADTGMIYFFNSKGERIQDFLHEDGSPRLGFERTLLVSPETYRGFSVATIDATGGVALHEMVVSLELSPSLLDVLERGVRAEV